MGSIHHFFLSWFAAENSDSPIGKTFLSVVIGFGLVLGICSIFFIIWCVWKVAAGQVSEQGGKNWQAVLLFSRYIFSAILWFVGNSYLNKLFNVEDAVDENQWEWGNYLSIALGAAIVGLNIGYSKIKAWLTKETQSD